MPVTGEDDRVRAAEHRYRDAERRMWESVGVRPVERVLSLRRTGATVRVQEAGAGPPAVFVHGGSNSGTSWAPLVARLGDFRCVVLDRPGCGLSPPLPGQLADVAALGDFADALVVDLLDALDVPAAHVVATSFGGYFALRAAAAHPDRIRRVVELGWAVGAPIERVPLVMRLAAVPVLGQLLAAVPPNERAVRSMFRSIGLRQALDAGRVSQEVIDCFLSLLRDTKTMRNELALGPRLVTPVRGFNPEMLLSASLLGSISVPVCFLWGDEDPFGGAAVARAFAAQVPEAVLELLPGAGHAVWIDDPDRTAATTRAFLDG